MSLLLDTAFRETPPQAKGRRHRRQGTCREMCAAARTCSSAVRANQVTSAAARCRIRGREGMTMDRSARGKLIADWLWFLVFAAASSVWCATAAVQLGPTFDEPLYVTRGLE